MRWLRYAAVGCIGFVLLVAIAALAARLFADGPIAFLQGGPFKSGTYATSDPESWESLLDGTSGNLQFELTGFGSTRTTGFMVHEGELYIPCDLGFMWGRLEGGARYLLHAIYIFKTWHRDALVDGRTVLRVGSTLIRGQLRRVTDQGVAEALRGLLNDRYAQELGPPPVEEPRDIWFFQFLPQLEPS